MKQLSKSVIYLLSLIAVEAFFWQFTKPVSVPHFEIPNFMPLALGAEKRAVRNDHEIVSSPETRDESFADEGSVSDPALSYTLQDIKGWYAPDAKDNLRNEGAGRELANGMQAMRDEVFIPATEIEYLGRDPKGFDQFEYLTEAGDHIIQWKNGTNVVVEVVTYASGDKLVRRPSEFEGKPAEIDMSYPDGTFRRVVYHQSGEVATLHAVSRMHDTGELTEVLTRYDRDGQATEFYVGPKNLPTESE